MIILTRTTKCPICNNKAKWENYSSSWGTEEEYINCPICGYRSEFAYGNYLEEVGNKWFIWSYSQNNPQFFKKIARARFMARRRWKKHKKGTYNKDCPI